MGIPILYVNSSFILWESLQYSTIKYPLLLLRGFNTHDISLDNFYIITLYYMLYNTGFSNSTNSFFWYSTKPNNQYFIMDSTSSICSQSVITHIFQYVFELSIVDLIPFIVDISFFVILILIYTYTTSK